MEPQARGVKGVGGAKVALMSRWLLRWLFEGLVDLKTSNSHLKLSQFSELSSATFRS